jgi:hypothetical protein
MLVGIGMLLFAIAQIAFVVLATRGGYRKPDPQRRTYCAGECGRSIIGEPVERTGERAVAYLCSNCGGCKAYIMRVTPAKGMGPAA